MSIYSRPFPSDGVDLVPTKFQGEAIMGQAFTTDGKECLRDLEAFLEWKPVGEGLDLKLPSFKSGVTLDRVRKLIGSLWKRMSKKAKANYLAVQYTQAVQYLDEVMDNIKEEFGDDVHPEILPLPSSTELLGQWLK